MLARVRAQLEELRKDERGLTVVEIVLLIALIVLPIVLVLILFGKDIKSFIKNMWTQTNNEANNLKGGINSGGR
jgi:Flp pilus assembly pilin Flp